jgi:hypothetical protein
MEADECISAELGDLLKIIYVDGADLEFRFSYLCSCMFITSAKTAHTHTHTHTQFMAMAVMSIDQRTLKVSWVQCSSLLVQAVAIH